MNETNLTPNVNIDAATAAANKLIVSDPEEYKAAGSHLTQIKSVRKNVVEFFREPKMKARAAWQSIVDREKYFTQKIDQIEKIVKGKMLSYTREQERIAREKEERLRAIEEEKARAERAKLEAQRKRFETMNKQDIAQKYEEKASTVQAAEVRVVAPKPSADGIQTRKVWKVRIDDLSAFLRTAAADTVLQSTIEIKSHLLLKMRGRHEIPGVKFYQENQIASSSF